MTAIQARQAWEAGNRRRRAAELAERAADAALAAGALLVANVTLPLNLGLPTGRIGLLSAAALICAGIALMMAKRPVRPQPRPIAIHPVTVERAA